MIMKFQAMVTKGCRLEFKRFERSFQNLVLIAFFSFGSCLWGATEEKTLMVSGSATSQERTRKYLMRLPSNSSKPAALVLVFHGGGSNAQTMENYTGLSSKADEAGFMVVYPEGLHHFWNDERSPSGRESLRVWRQAQPPNDVQFISQLLDQLIAEYSLDPHRIYLTGISNGAVFCHFLAVKLGDRIAAIAPVAGNLPREMMTTSSISAPKANSVSIIAFNGTDDSVMPYEGGEVHGVIGQEVESWESTARFWVQRNHSNTSLLWSEPFSFPNRNRRDRASAVRYEALDSRQQILNPAYCFIKIQGGGHTWPGVNKTDLRSRIYERKFGQTCLDIDANDLMWEFFREHPKL
jgi:polyhydroxybutyrate depolymerase